MRKPPAPPPIKTCPVCGITMIASKSRDDLAHFDTFTCLSCGSVTALSAPPPKPPPQSPP